MYAKAEIVIRKRFNDSHLAMRVVMTECHIRYGVDLMVMLKLVRY